MIHYHWKCYKSTSIILGLTSDDPRMSSPSQGSSKNFEFNARKIEFNPNVSHFIWFSPLSQNTELSKKSEKSSTDIKDLNDLEEEIEENFNLEKFEPPSKNEKNKCLIKTKPTKIQKFKSKLVNFMKGSRFAGIPLAMSK